VQITRKRKDRVSVVVCNNKLWLVNCFSGVERDAAVYISSVLAVECFIMGRS